MSGEVVAMTPWQYWTRWAAAGVAFLFALAVLLYLVVTYPIVEALKGAGSR